LIMFSYQILTFNDFPNMDDSCLKKEKLKLSTFSNY